MDRIAYSIPEVAQLTGLSRRTIYELLRTGALPSVKAGARRMISAEALREFVSRTDPIQPRERTAAGAR